MGQLGGSKPLLWDAGIDWVTLTAPGRDEHTEALGQLFADLFDHEQEYGGQLKQQGWSGFHGPATDHLFFGVKDWGVMARASSSIANQVAKEVIARDIECRCTRLDFQTTIQAETEIAGFADLQRAAIKAPASLKKKARPRDINLYESADGGSGISVGDRSSSRCGRIYNKSAEQKMKIAPRLWRYEVEFKEGQARAFWKTCQESTELETLAQRAVVSYFNTVNIKEAWMVDVEPMRLPSTYRQTGDAKAMEWLLTLVGGTIERLASRGHEDWLRHWFESCIARGLEKPDPKGAMRSADRDAAEATAMIERLSRKR